MGVTKCGVATNQFHDCADCIFTAAKCGMSFWWNWDVKPTDYLVSGITAGDAEFVPMIWGSSFQGLTNVTQMPDLKRGTYLMGFNEPDHYGPPCWNKNDVGGWVYKGCDGVTYSSAASSGTWLPMFNPSGPYAANVWATVINQLLAFSGTMPQIVSPSMAGPINGGDKLQECLSVTNTSDPDLISTIGNCNGWLGAFKNATLQMTCGSTNCWDVIDHIQIHCYTHTADAVIKKIESYIEYFKEDFEGTNGRSKKTLWLTEVAQASDNLDEAIKFVNALIPYIVSKPEMFRVSWFSEWAFTSFATDGIAPKSPTWRSSLFDTFGKLSPLGTAYFTACNGGTLPSTCT